MLQCFMIQFSLLEKIMIIIAVIGKFIRNDHECINKGIHYRYLLSGDKYFCQAILSVLKRSYEESITTPNEHYSE